MGSSQKACPPRGFLVATMTISNTNGKSAASLSFALVLLNVIIVSWTYNFRNLVVKAYTQHSFKNVIGLQLQGCFLCYGCYTWKPSSVASWLFNFWQVKLTSSSSICSSSRACAKWHLKVKTVKTSILFQSIFFFLACIINIMSQKWPHVLRMTHTLNDRYIISLCRYVLYTNKQM